MSGLGGLRRFAREHEQGVLTALAAITYVGASIWFKGLSNWIVGPGWLVAWCWGVPAIGRLRRGEPVRPHPRGATGR